MSIVAFTFNTTLCRSLAFWLRQTSFVFQDNESVFGADGLLKVETHALTKNGFIEDGTRDEIGSYAETSSHK